MNTVLHGDCLEELKKISDSSIDLICTDPPYNVGYKYTGYKDNLSDIDYFEWQIEILRECERVLKPNGSLFYLHYPEFNSRVHVALQEDFELKPVEVIAWVYNTHTSGNPLRKSFRTWVWASKGQPTAHFQGEYRNPTDKRVAKLIADGRKPNEYDWWLFEQVKNVNKDKTAHPCQLPVKMVKKIIEGTTSRGDIVLDPFLGSGTTAIAAKQLGRQFIGIEREKEYVDIAEARLAAVPTTLV